MLLLKLLFPNFRCFVEFSFSHFSYCFATCSYSLAKIDICLFTLSYSSVNVIAFALLLLAAVLLLLNLCFANFISGFVDLAHVLVIPAFVLLLFWLISFLHLLPRVTKLATVLQHYIFFDTLATVLLILATVLHILATVFLALLLLLLGFCYL